MFFGPDVKGDVVEQLRHELGLDKPAVIQYLNYLRRLARGDLGQSISTRRPVAQELGRPFLATVQLSVASIVLATLVAMPLRTLAATKQGRIWDHAASVLALLGISIPVFCLGLLTNAPSRTGGQVSATGTRDESRMIGRSSALIRPPGVAPASGSPAHPPVREVARADSLFRPSAGPSGAGRMPSHGG